MDLITKIIIRSHCYICEKVLWQLREAFIKKNILLLTFVNKDFTPPPNY